MKWQQQMLLQEEEDYIFGSFLLLDCFGIVLGTFVAFGGARRRTSLPDSGHGGPRPFPQLDGATGGGGQRQTIPVGSWIGRGRRIPVVAVIVAIDDGRCGETRCFLVY